MVFDFSCFREIEFAFSAFTLLVGRQEEHLACKKWVMGYWRGYLSGVWCKWFALSSCCHCHPIVSCFSKIQNGLPFWCWLTQVVLEKRPLNVCMYVCTLWAKKTCHFILGHNSSISWWISTFCAPIKTRRNTLSEYYKICNVTTTVSLHYLRKF